MTRNLTLDFLKVLLACMVVGIHAGFFMDISAEGHFLTVNGVFRIAVPIFFIINGYYFASILNIDSLVRWIKRILSLYAFWMLLYAYYWYRPESFGVVKIIEFVLVGYSQLWYLPAMIGAGVLTYLLKDKVQLGIYLSSFCFVLGVFIQYVGNYHVLESPALDELANTGYVHRNFIFFGFPFFYMGLLFKRECFFQESSNTMLWFMFILGLGLLLGESWFSYNNPSHNDPWLDNCLSLVLVCPALFLLVNRSKLTYEGKLLSLLSTAIYLIHPFWLIFLNSISVPMGTSLTLACILLSILSSYVLIFVQRRIRFIL